MSVEVPDRCSLPEASLSGEILIPPIHGDTVHLSYKKIPQLIADSFENALLAVVGFFLARVPSPTPGPSGPLLAMHSVSGQIAAPVEPDDILNALTSHHTLERVEYPDTTYRFEHQQFQEYYYALTLRDELGKMVDSKDPAQAKEFEKKYVNDPSWEEPLHMIAAESNDTTRGIAAGARLVRLALRVDAVLAAKLSYLAGQSVWRKSVATSQSPRGITLNVRPDAFFTMEDRWRDRGSQSVLLLLGD